MSSPTSEPSPAPGLARALIRPAFRLDRTQIKPMLGVEGAIGIAIPLILGLSTGHTDAGTWGAIGAFLTNFSLFQPGYRIRVRIVVVASVVVATAIFLGALVGIHDPAVFALVAGWSFGAGMLVAISPNAAIIGVVSSVGMMVATSTNATAAVAAEYGAAALGGGACVALLAVAFHRGRRPENVALAAAFQALADYALAMSKGELRLPDAAPFDSLSATLAVPGSHRFRALAFRDGYLAKQAEALRTALAALAMTRDRASRGDGGSNADVVGSIDLFADAVANLLGDLALACAADRAPGDAGADAHRTFVASRALARTGHRRIENTAGTLYREILCALRAARRGLRGPGGRSTAAVPVHSRLSVSSLRHRPDSPDEALLAIRSNLTLRSTACRHALRLATAVTIATLLYRVIDTHDGFWIVVAVIFIMKPDFGSTVGRGLLRIVGTLAGATLATLLLASVQPGPVALSVLTVVTSAFAYALFSANYGAFTIFLTCLTVFLAALLGLPPMTAVANRAVDNVLGASLSILAVVVWPSWVAAEVPHLVATCLRAEQRFCDAVLSAFAARRAATEAAVVPDAATDALVRAARLARSNAEAAVERMAAETPGLHKGTLSLMTAEGVLAQMHRYGLAGLWLRALADQDVDSKTESLAREQRWLSASVTAVAEAVEAGDLLPLAERGPVPWDHEDAAVAGIVNVMLDAVQTVLVLYDESLVPTTAPEPTPAGRPWHGWEGWRLRPLAVVPTGALSHRPSPRRDGSGRTR